MVGTPSGCLGRSCAPPHAEPLTTLPRAYSTNQGGDDPRGTLAKARMTNTDHMHNKEATP